MLANQNAAPAAETVATPAATPTAATVDPLREQALAEAQTSPTQVAADTQHRLTLDAYRQTTDEQNRALEAARRQTRRDTSVMLSRLDRYLPYAQRQAGTAGSGAATTAGLSLYNEALRRMSEADAAYTEGVRQNETAYSQSRAELEAAKAEADAQRQETAIGEARTQSQNRYLSISGDLDGMYAAALEQGTDGKISPEDMAAIRAAADEYRGQLGTEEQLQMDTLLKGYERMVRSERAQAQVTAQATGAKQFGDFDKLKAGANFAVALTTEEDGTKKTTSYQVQVKEIVTDEAIRKKALDVEMGEVFALGEELYIRMPGNNNNKEGTVVRIGRRPTNKRSYTKLWNAVFGKMQ